MLKLYQSEWCPYCKNVRNWIAENLNEVEIVYISQPHDRSARKQVLEVSGQAFIPTLLDAETGTIIADDDQKIIEYLAQKFGK
ncbi:MAG: hypothetical protein A3F33_02175 [Candidatus Woykebacteria bacterium RIFCSPHIGHO2_12_FULL_43_10]|uniref:GST N-terminal domain-containing protein n=2 Tax=Candidatus Woykeibacteriota TaxID=1817899 RepID=A0A1G1WX48_9BACT|nr:MAG: hypothetical protein A2802_01890 [Candidatus Woykebacteria bacterium RIFCSPHIGHO2_01_FULL_43_29]OGY28770.1 MAG: hypothetical protein A3F33_02175 [Candidatus Woykebacteria bacterium RIFCSPHIGHO2_12_FULL_43_10]OGY29346.1 MAG: hypothetical protein A3J50_02570 [Candidatus Woykebacteria bacterium RIFCSPHIGHO2_02_FULL_43_16b]OGY32299.1 MAG: hypothetical protein A3A61_04410 [Candidatus Woykebacteria bacterium RIFCSPLOWO2_01_FULL_43_14]